EVPMEGLFLRRPQPDIEVEVGGRFFNRFESDAPTGLAAVAFRDEQFAVVAAFDERGERRLAAGAALRAVLNDAIVFAGRLHALPPLEDIVAAGFLDVHVLSRLTGPDRHQ